jgi:hypothetical protein
MPSPCCIQNAPWLLVARMVMPLPTTQHLLLDAQLKNIASEAGRAATNGSVEECV